MFDRIARWQPDRSTAVATRTMGALTLIALAVIHVVDLPGTLGSTPLVGGRLRCRNLTSPSGGISVFGSTPARAGWYQGSSARPSRSLG